MAAWSSNCRHERDGTMVADADDAAGRRWRPGHRTAGMSGTAQWSLMLTTPLGGDGGLVIELPA
jgi:hypothetical protein